MSSGLMLAELVAAGEALVGALDQDDIAEIETALTRFRLAVDGARASGMRAPPPELGAIAERIARADLELRSSPPDKRLVLERLIYDLASEPKPQLSGMTNQLSFES